MTRNEACSRIDEAIRAFSVEGVIESCYPYGDGHINDTFLLKMKKENQTIAYILQRINHEVFAQPEILINNIRAVTEFLRKKIIINGGNPERETLNLVRTRDGKYYYKDSINSYWRIYLFIDDAVCYNVVENEQDFYQSAVAFGRFQRLLADFPAESLHETIKDFHNTKLRFQTLKRAIEEDKFGRVKEAEKEIETALSHEHIANTMEELRVKRILPLRVVHNDTKMNNVMIDQKTEKALCVIDLDTVMPGLSVYDFGDSIRFGASTAPEDETDLSKVSCSMDLFESYARGYLEGCGEALTQEEIKYLPLGAVAMTYECAIRFLTDYLQGDTYFKIHREKHNLERCRTQLKLVEDLERKWDTMNSIISRCEKAKHLL